MSDSNFVIENGILTKYVGKGGDVVIPCGVTEIGSSAFFGCKSLTTISISPSVHTIGTHAFYGCRELKTITFSSNIKWIASYAFDECDNIQAVLFSNDVITSEAPSIASVCFYFSGSDYTTTIAYSFLKHASDIILKNGSLRKMVKDNRKNILKTAIKNDDSYVTERFLSLYKTVKLDDLNKYIEMSDGSVAVKAFLIDYKDKQYPKEIQDAIYTEKTEKQLGLRELSVDDLKKIFSLWPYTHGKKEGQVITSYKGTDTNIIIPSQIGKKDILAIGPDAFSPEMKTKPPVKETRKRIESITVSEGIKVICGDKWHSGAFCNCKLLSEINLPDTLVEIGSYSFSGCEILGSINIPTNVKKIGEQAFYNCTEMKTAILPAKVKKIEKDAFEGCPNLTIHAPAGSYAEQYAKENHIPFVAEE